MWFYCGCLYVCLIVKTAYAQIEVNILPLTSTQGGTLNASYNQRVSGTPTWLCYRFNSTGPINTSLAAIVQVRRIPSMRIPLQACSVPKTQLRTHQFLSRGATLVKYIYEQGLVQHLVILSKTITTMFALGCQFLYRLVQK